MAQTADTIQRKNAELVAEVRSLSWIWLVTVGVAILLVGVFGGITWEQHNVGELVVNLQNQVGQLQQILQTSVTPAAEPAGKHLKKK